MVNEQPPYICRRQKLLLLLDKLAQETEDPDCRVIVLLKAAETLLDYFVKYEFPESVEDAFSEYVIELEAAVKKGAVACIHRKWIEVLCYLHEFAMSTHLIQISEDIN